MNYLAGAANDLDELLDVGETRFLPTLAREKRADFMDLLLRLRIFHAELVASAERGGAA